MKHQAQPNTNWIDLGMASWQLCSDAAAVVWLRSARIAQGGAPAAAETQRMIAEKVEANVEFMMDVATGAAGISPQAVATSAVGMYGKKVRANRRRLSR